jgi:signal transduction histidine kinase
VHHPDKAHDRDFQTLFYHQELANCYKLKGDHQHYENLLEKIIAEKDADYQASSASAIAELETRYQFQKKEELISRQKLQLAHRNLMLYSALLVLVLGSVIVWLVFKAYRRRQSVRATLAVNEAGESERKRISADLHDNLGAQISFIKRNVEFLIDQPEGFKTADQSRYLGYINDFANSAMIDLRETIWVLNKNEVYLTEFTDKLRFYLFQQLQVAAPVNWELVDDIRLNWKLTSTEVMHLFRIMQELVSNILQHARADQIRIRLTSDQIQHYRLEVTDNGCGFDADQPPPGHYGLVNLRQRAMELGAALELRSLPGKGTRVILNK